MPTIDLSNNNQTSGDDNNNSNSTIPVTTPAPKPAPPPPVQTPAPNSGGWNDPWGAPWGGGQPDGNSGGKRLSPQERVEMIEKVFNEILNRKPDTRDINYYKYSTLSEEEIKKQLLTGNEHKQLLLDGRDYKKLKDRALQAETRVKVLEGQIRDQVEEFRQLTNLLKEKNRHIQEMRERLNSEKKESPFGNGLPTANVFLNPQPILASHSEEESPKQAKLVDRIKTIISDLF